MVSALPSLSSLENPATLELQNSISTCMDDVANGCLPRGSFKLLQKPPVDASICYQSHQLEWALTKSSQFPLCTTLASMRPHASETVAACFAILRQLRSIRRSVPRSVLQSLVSSLVLQRLDYSNATLAGILYHLTKRMQPVLNFAARLLFSASRYDRFTSLLTQVHWLKVPERIEFKLTVIHNTAPPYPAEAFHQSSADEDNVSAVHRHHRLLSLAPVFQPSAIERFRSLLPTVKHSAVERHVGILKTLLFRHYLPESPVVPVQ